MVVKPVITTALSATICEGQTYSLPSGAIANTTGLYKDTIRYTGSTCDSLVTTVNLLVQAVIRDTVNASICIGQSYTLPSGIVVNTAGTYIDTLKYLTGCDSLIVTTNLLVGSPTTNNVTVTLCSGETYTLPSGTVVSTTGLFRDTVRSRAGCDSLITVADVTAYSLITNSISRSLCTGQSFTLPSGKVVNTTGIHRDTIRYASVNCDSLITILDLRVAVVRRVQLMVTLCAGEVYTMPSGVIVSTTGNYTDTVRSSFGCDSLVTNIELLKLPTIVTAKAQILCPGQTFRLPASGVIVSQSGIYNDTISSRGGCDSVINIYTIRVQQAQLQNLNAAICQGDMYQLPWGGMVMLAGAYYDTIRSTAGCDSIIRKVTLFVKPLPNVRVFKSNDINCTKGFATLTAVGGRSYQWSPAATMSDASSASPVVTPPATTTYKVTATGANGCIAADSIRVIVDKTTGEIVLPNAFTPNGDSKNDCFSLRSIGFLTDLTFSVYNRWGERVFTTNDASKCWDGTYNGVAQPTGTFVYQLKANSNCGPAVMKGTIILLR